jgi:hypothetical protein
LYVDVLRDRLTPRKHSEAAKQMEEGPWFVHGDQAALLLKFYLRSGLSQAELRNVVALRPAIALWC